MIRLQIGTCFIADSEQLDLKPTLPSLAFPGTRPEIALISLSLIFEFKFVTDHYFFGMSVLAINMWVSH